ncbi:hypothetical protein P167DRAFT_579295 [Morchella conica CCBAS932]|uniref:GATA-type domain-containing protein n=2 Tax=Morchella sect. Distantes TaxID=1051054 RepID=A0A3N4KAB8_9PEZI|nr:hypothetical protein P167DRAFT_579295 [Morchella conica CCBAS932]
MSTYMGGFEGVAGESTRYHQQNSSINRTSISTASPISPTTTFGPTPPLSFPPPAPSHSGYNTPPDSRKTSRNEDCRQTLPPLAEGRQSLPSLSEALCRDDRFPAPSPMQTPPLGQGSFSGPSGPHPDSMPRSQPETLPSVQTLPLSGSTTSSSLYSHSTPLPPPPPAPQSSAGPSPMHSHESYNRRNSQEHSRTLPPNPYAAAPPQPVIPAIRPSDPYPAPPTNGHSSYQPSHPYPPPPPHHITSPQYPPTPSYSNGSSTSQQYPFPQHSSAPPPQSAYQPHPQPPHSTSSYSYPPRDAYPHDPPQTSPGSGGGMKRNYGSTIERALSISTLRRDFDLTKENSAKIYYIVQSCQDVAKNLQPNLLDHCLRELSDAIDCSTRNTEALRSCQQVFQELCAKEYAEQNAAQRVSTNHSSEYGGDDNHGYADDTRSNGSAQPDAKKIRRGRAAPPGRCHSCHRAETPEWRRGPDGARTLCNACGLHYAKLTRKLSKSNMNTNGSGQIAGRNAPNSPLP